jgi:hypothetical protein
MLRNIFNKTSHIKLAFENPRFRPLHFPPCTTAIDMKNVEYDVACIRDPIRLFSQQATVRRVQQ